MRLNVRAKREAEFGAAGNRGVESLFGGVEQPQHAVEVLFMAVTRGVEDVACGPPARFGAVATVLLATVL